MMIPVASDRRLWLKLVLVVGLLAVGASAESPVLPGPVPAGRRVMAFYYPWYGTKDGPGGAGRTVHWGRIDAQGRDIEQSTHYPQLGAYDSHDPKLIDQHCRWARRAGVDTLIVSWWGHGSFSDRAMNAILQGCRNHGLMACIYYESVPGARTPEAAADDIGRVLVKYGRDRNYFKVENKPVVFVYGRALGQLGLTGWLGAIRIINEKYKPGVTAIGDQFSYGAARVFDGIHTYNTAGSLKAMTPEDVRNWAPGTYESAVQLADGAGKISTLTVIPGYDDTKIRKPGLAVKRYGGQLYRAQWDSAIKADPHWILITSFNEWHEGSEIEPSHEDGDAYLDLTASYAKRFKARPRAVHRRSASSGISAREKARLREKFAGARVGVLADADSMAFWWLLEAGVDLEILSSEKVADGGLSPKKCAVLLYCAGELYRRTVNRTGDVDDALAEYLEAGGCLAVLPSRPWPFFYDADGKVVKGGGRFGLTLRQGWERPAEGAKLRFVQPGRRLTHVPAQFDFPETGDLRWRPMFAGDHAKYVSLLQLHDADGKNLGDGVAYAELKGGGRIVYVWFALMDGPHAEGLLYDVFNFLAAHLP